MYDRIDDISMLNNLPYYKLLSKKVLLTRKHIIYKLMVVTLANNVNY